jgi:hypothetical protein
VAAFDIDEELAKLDEQDQALSDEADELGAQVTEGRARLLEINTARRELAARGEALRKAKSMDNESLRQLLQVVDEAGGVESLAAVGTPGEGDEGEE